MPFKVNDNVELIDESVEGRIISIQGNRIVILTEEGFEREVAAQEIIKVGSASALTVTKAEIANALKDKEDIPRSKEHNGIKKSRHGLFIEIDLHIHNLTDDTRGMTNYEMLTLQLETARKKLELAIKKHIKKVIFIHGVGEGVLKTELEALFKTYENLKYYDADFREYGAGATEVYIYQNY